MTDEEKALEWFRNRRTAVTMKGTREWSAWRRRSGKEKNVGEIQGNTRKDKEQITCLCCYRYSHR